jgi:hypothetical protein
MKKYHFSKPDLKFTLNISIFKNSTDFSKIFAKYYTKIIYSNLPKNNALN